MSITRCERAVIARKLLLTLERTLSYETLRPVGPHPSVSLHLECISRVNTEKGVEVHSDGGTSSRNDLGIRSARALGSGGIL
jgi:hypothetical protein